MKPIAFIPHKQRVAEHKVDYLRAMAEVMDNPWQAEDGRDLAPIQEKLNKKFADIEAAHKLMREAPSDGGWAYIIGLVVIFFIFWMILE